MSQPHKFYFLSFMPKFIVQLTLWIKRSETMEFIYTAETVDVPQIYAKIVQKHFPHLFVQI